MLTYPMINKPEFRIFSLLLILLFLFQACKDPSEEDKQKFVFRFNESNGISSLDPAFAKDLANVNICNQIYNGLVQLDSNLQIQGCIANSWQVSDDGKKYSFFLRDDVYFHPNQAFNTGIGRKVIAADFVYSFNRIINEKIGSPGAWVFNSVKRNAFSAPNDSTFIIELENPFAPFLSLLSMQYCSVIPFEAVEYYAENFRKNPVGTGPFYMKFWEEDIKLVLLKNPNYFERDNQGNRLPHLEAVNISFLVDRQSEFLQFIQGKLDYLSGIESSFKDEILSENGAISEKYKEKIKLIKSPYLNTEYIGILSDTNIQSVKNSPLKHLKFRQAINYAIDKQKMLRYLRNNIGSPGHKGFLPEAFTSEKSNYGYNYDKQKAIELLNELKSAQNISEFPAITVVASAKSIDFVKFIQHQLAEIGIEMEIELMQWAALKEVIATSKANFFRGSWIADYPDPENYLSLFYSPNFSPKGPNYTHFKNDKFDALYNASIQSTSINSKHKLYRAMDSLIMSESVVIPLYYDEVLRFTQLSINDLPKNPMNLLNLKYVKKEIN